MTGASTTSQRQARKLCKRGQQYTESSGKKPGDGRAGEETRKSRLERSLQIAHDPRFKEIEYYREQESDRLDKIVAGFLKNADQPRLTDMGPPISAPGAYPTHRRPPPSNKEFDRLVQQLVDSSAGGERQFAAHAAEKFGGRIRWEESFKSKVKHLMVDFQLSEDPECRLNHLDRMHGWFCQEGGKQARKDKARPMFLTVGKYEVPPPGSARSAPPPSNHLTLGLAASLRMPESARLERHFGAVPGPGPPRPGYR